MEQLTFIYSSSYFDPTDTKTKSRLGYSWHVSILGALTVVDKANLALLFFSFFKKKKKELLLTNSSGGNTRHLVIWLNVLLRVK